ncbi:MAG: nucleotidyltransferase substrate binding protein [Lachnospiraceae bacterium]|nr:nucleotidyltransferase substrate binding protein [Lachnospiraceae bacterium]
MKKYENFCKALANLQEGLALQEPYSIVEQTGIVGLFEICFEQSWKMMKEILERHGRFENKIGSPRAIIKIAYQCDMISDEILWLKLLEARNILSYTYSEEEALTVIRSLKSDYIRAFELLKKEVDERWLPGTGDKENPVM